MNSSPFPRHLKRSWWRPCLRRVLEGNSAGYMHPVPGNSPYVRRWFRCFGWSGPCCQRLRPVPGEVVPDEFSDRIQSCFPWELRGSWQRQCQTFWQVSKNRTPQAHRWQSLPGCRSPVRGPLPLPTEWAPCRIFSRPPFRKFSGLCRKPPPGLSEPDKGVPGAQDHRLPQQIPSQVLWGRYPGLESL